MVYGHYISPKSQTLVIGLSLLCSENCLLCILALLQFCTYNARFYATQASPQLIMLVIIHSLMPESDLSRTSSCYNHFTSA